MKSRGEKRLGPLRDHGQGGNVEARVDVICGCALILFINCRWVFS